jgi:hypothetical protein
MRCPPFWSENPRILLDDAREFFPFSENDARCTAAALNSFTRFGIYFGITLAIVRLNPAWLIIGILFATFAFIAWTYMEKTGTVREGFVDTLKVEGKPVPDVIGVEKRTESTAANPFMNVLLSEISDNPTRPPARYRTDLDKYFETKFYNDPGDAFQHMQSQRQWVTQPSTTIPNDQESFQNWLYRTPGVSCKEGNMDVCNFDSGDASYPWREIRKLT